MHDIGAFNQSIIVKNTCILPYCDPFALLPLYHRGGLPDWLAAAGQALAWPGMLAAAWTCRARADAHTAARTTLLRGHTTCIDALCIPTSNKHHGDGGRPAAGTRRRRSREAVPAGGGGRIDSFRRGSVGRQGVGARVRGVGLEGLRRSNVGR